MAANMEFSVERIDKYRWQDQPERKWAEGREGESWKWKEVKKCYHCHNQLMIINLLNNYLVLVVQKLNLCSRTSYLLGSQKKGGQEPKVVVLQHIIQFNRWSRTDWRLCWSGWCLWVTLVRMISASIVQWNVYTNWYTGRRKIPRARYVTTKYLGERHCFAASGPRQDLEVPQTQVTSE